MGGGRSDSRHGRPERNGTDTNLPLKGGSEDGLLRSQFGGSTPTSFHPCSLRSQLSKVEAWGAQGIDHLLALPESPDAEIMAKFTHFLAMTLSRREPPPVRLRTMTEEMMRLQYGSLTRASVWSMLREGGGEPSEEEVDETLAFVEEVRSGTLVLSPQDPALIGLAAESSQQVGEVLLHRRWSLFRTPRVLVTCDEPVVLIGGPGHLRNERPGVATAGAVVFPLVPDLALVMFHPHRAFRLGMPEHPLPVGELDLVDTQELNREIAMSCHRWVFERPGLRIGARMDIPPDPGTAVIEERPDLYAIDRPEGEILRCFTRGRSRNPRDGRSHPGGFEPPPSDGDVDADR